MRGALLLLVPLLAPAAAPAQAASPTTGRVVVVLEEREGTRAKAAASTAVAARADAGRGATVPELGVLAVRPRGGDSPRELAARLRRDPAVRSARPEIRLRPRYTPNDAGLTAPELRAPSGTPMQWPLLRQNLPRAWDITRGDGALVGVIDTGIDGGHPDLAGRIARAIDQGGGPAQADDSGHGTHVSSLACAATDNATGLAGTGFNCRLIFERTDFTEVSIANSIVDAVDSGADAVNMSFGDDGTGPQSEAIRAAIEYGVARSVVFVAAAADQPVEEQGQPANMLQPTGTGSDLDAGRGLSVTSADFAGGRSAFAGRGSQISLAAYGSFGGTGPPGLLGAFPAHRTEIERGVPGVPPIPPCAICRTSFAGDNRYAYLQGTSMAAPQVAAVAALIRNLNPDLPLDELLRLLKETAGNQGWEPELGWGVVDAGAAIDAARTLDRTRPVSRVTAPSRSSKARFTVRWIGTDPVRPGVRSTGVRLYEVYAKADSGSYKRIARTRRRYVRFTGKPGRRYRFYSLATDRAGNRERSPTRADAATRVAPSE